MPFSRKIIHIDMDAFFASVEQLDQPELRGRPVIVGGEPGGRGVVAACSYEARVFGVHSAMPAGRAAQLCPRAVFLRPRMDRYREVSRQIMALFHRYTPLVEPLSVDEAFLDVTDNLLGEPSATRLAQAIRTDIHATTGLTASAGVSCNKFLAKVASGRQKPDGLTVIPPGQAAAFIRELSQFGLPIHVAELDASLRTGNRLFDLKPRQQRIERQTARVAELAEAFMALPRAQQFAFTVWGVRDTDHWLRRGNKDDGQDSPLLFDAAGRANPMFHAVADAFGG